MRKKECTLAGSFLAILALFILFIKFYFPEAKELPLYITFSDKELHQLITRLPKQEQAQMLAAGENLLKWQEVLRKTEESVVTQVIGKRVKTRKMKHYPKGDVFDDESQSGYFYHAHRKKEHGHFHLFFSEDLFDTPSLCRGKPYTHIIGISMDEAGNPRSIFTVNQWVTGEKWQVSEEICKRLKAFHIDHAFPSYLTNQWLSALVAFFSPQIELLIQKRDERLNAYRQRGMKNVFQNRQVEIVTECPISIEKQVNILKKSFSI